MRDTVSYLDGKTMRSINALLALLVLWYNAQISAWTAERGLTLVNFTPGTRSNADYTTPDMGDRYPL